MEGNRKLRRPDHHDDESGLVAAMAEVGRAEGRGRLVRAPPQRGVTAGQLVASSEVFVWSYLPREARRVCAHCGRRPVAAPVRCRGGCSTTWYCPPPSSCAEAGETYHGGAGCRSVRRYEAAVAMGLRRGTLACSLFGSPEASMFARLVIGVLAHPDRRRRALTLALEPNMHALPPDRLGQFERIAEAVAASVGLPRGEEAKVTKEDVLRLLCIQQCNAFGLSNDDGEMIGIAIYPELSLFNHSCLPNCASTDDPTGNKRRSLIKTITAVPPGEEMVISYIALDMSRELRRKKLGDSYAFKCTCRRCSVDEDTPEMISYRDRITCGDCGGTLIPTPPGQERLVACNSCPFVGCSRGSTEQPEHGSRT